MPHIVTRSVPLLLAIASLNVVAADELPQRLKACADVREDAARLHCFDALAAQTGGSVVNAPKTSKEKNASEIAARVAPDEAGAPPGAAHAPTQAATPKSASTSAPEQFTSKAVRVDRRPHDRWAVTLENGEVWEQNETNPSVVLHPGDVVTIRKGLLGSHKLLGPSRVETYVKKAR